jgi:hypothetical protein
MFVSKAEFARMCGVTRQAVQKWETSGCIVLQGKEVDVIASHDRMMRYRVGGSPLRQPPVDNRVNQPSTASASSRDLSTDELLAAVDGTRTFDFSHGGLTRRLTTVAEILGFDLIVDGDDIDLHRNGESHFLCDGFTFEENAFLALENLRWWLRGDQAVPDAFRPAIPLLGTPFGAPATVAWSDEEEAS